MDLKNWLRFVGVVEVLVLHVVVVVGVVVAIPVRIQELLFDTDKGIEV
jgi:hypothetical protein